MASRVVSVSHAAGIIRSGQFTYYGFSLRETGAAVATIRVWDNTSAAGTLLDTIRLSANESAREFYLPNGLRVNTGIFIEVVAGTVEGSYRLG